MHLTIPDLSPQIPSAYAAAEPSVLGRDIAIALLELGMVAEDDLAKSNKARRKLGNSPEAAAAESALTRWWNEQMAQLKFFDWWLNLQMITDFGHRRMLDREPIWHTMGINGQEHTVYVEIGASITALDQEFPGCGQTVLAVLYDALRYLPESLCPRRALGMAEYYHWGGNSSEEGYINDLLEMGDFASREDLLAEMDLFTRADFFANMPEWVINPKRLCSREEIGFRVTSSWGRKVVAACDALWELVTAPAFRKVAQTGFHGSELECECSSFCLFVRWSRDDACSRVIDDFINNLCDGAECHEFISARPIERTTEAMRNEIRAVEAMVAVASHVETLLKLLDPEIGQP